MEQNRATFRQGLMKLIEPIYPNNIVASIYCAVALALLLVYLYQGNALFFIFNRVRSASAERRTRRD